MYAYNSVNMYVCDEQQRHKFSPILEFFKNLAQILRMRDGTDAYVWHDSFICVTWLNYVCDMNYSDVQHDSFMCATWIFYVCDVTHSFVRHDSIFCVM